MGVAPPSSQVVPLPSNLPFRLVSKTIGAGAYASIRKAVPLNRSTPVIAIKFINKDHALRNGKLTTKQIQLEISVHQLVAQHQNIIGFYHHGEDASWYWMALELADGGDLFDKIEADEGVTEDVAHVYFKQLINAISWCHGKGVAHRDIKPENMLLAANGDLKVADFGLGTVYADLRSGKTKSCATVCGSPPYIAPEIIRVYKINSARKQGQAVERATYRPDMTDLWSCAIVLFVLLAGNTPWDAPTQESEEFVDFVQSKGRPQDELWEQVPNDVLSLLRGMLKVEPTERFTLTEIRGHPWFTQKNSFINEKGNLVDSVAFATRMMERLHIDFSKAPTSQPTAMDIDARASQAPEWHAAFAATQPDTRLDDIPADWEAPPRLGGHHHHGGGMSASQPTTALDRQNAAAFDDFTNQLSQDPSMSQFTQSHQIPLSLTQQAKQFKDIAPAHSLARFYSSMGKWQLLQLLQSALHQLNVPTPTPREVDGETLYLQVKTHDVRKCPLQGNIIVDAVRGTGLLEVRFSKAKGDPLEWRRLFKRVTVLCRDAVLVPKGDGMVG